MARAFLPAFRAALLLAGLAAVHAVAAAGGSARDGDRRVTNSFTLLSSAPANPAPRGGQSNGVGVAPSKPVVSNPYNVPLLQNAGSFGAMR
jgi:phage tail tape-measure protein